VDETDVRTIGRSSGSFCGVRSILIGFEDMAEPPLCAVDAVEEDDALVLFLASDETVRGHGLDWAVELGCCWVGFGLLRPVRLAPLSLLFLF
jgi:hypothetical protein